MTAWYRLGASGVYCLVQVGGSRTLLLGTRWDFPEFTAWYRVEAPGIYCLVQGLGPGSLLLVQGEVSDSLLLGTGWGLREFIAWYRVWVLGVYCLVQRGGSGSLLHLVLEWLEESRCGSSRVNQYAAQHTVDMSHLKVTPQFIIIINIKKHNNVFICLSVRVLLMIRQNVNLLASIL